MTNLIQTTMLVTTLLTTNITESDNHTGCSICDGIRKNFWALYHPCDQVGVPYVPATERTITTTVTRETTYEFDVIGCHKRLSESTVVTNWARHLRLKTEWEDCTPTNGIGYEAWPPGSSVTNWGGPFSNIIITGKAMFQTNLMNPGWTNSVAIEAPRR